MSVREAFIIGAAMFYWAGVAHGDNSACWGDNSRKDIGCTQITEKLLLSFRGETTDVIRKAMKAPGRKIDSGLHLSAIMAEAKKAGPAI